MAAPYETDEKYLMAISRRIMSRGTHLLDTFLEMDIDGDGSISRNDLNKALQEKFGIELSRRDLDAICTKYGCSDSRKVKYEDFVRFIRETATTFPLTSSAYGAGSEHSFEERPHNAEMHSTYAGRDVCEMCVVPDESNTRDVLRVIRRKLRNRTHPGHLVNEAFLAIDKNHTGYVTVVQFRSYLSSVGLELSEKKCREVLADFLGSGPHHNKANFSEFAKFVLSLEPMREVMPWEKLDEESLKRERILQKHLLKYSTEAYKKAVAKCADDALSDSKLIANFAQEIEFKKWNLVKAFKRFDHHNTGKLIKSDFAAALREVGMDVSDERADSLLDKFDVNHDGKLATWEFIRMVSSLTSTPDFEEKLKPIKQPEAKEETKGESKEELAAPFSQYSKGDGGEEEDSQGSIAKALTEEDIQILSSFRATIEESRMKVSKIFARMDEDMSKSLTKEQFFKGLKDIGVTNVTEAGMSLSLKLSLSLERLTLSRTIVTLPM
jgi:Ca2+-binding EF-hand superfamily protein